MDRACGLLSVSHFWMWYWKSSAFAGSLHLALVCSRQEILLCGIPRVGGFLCVYFNGKPLATVLGPYHSCSCSLLIWEGSFYFWKDKFLSSTREQVCSLVLMGWVQTPPEDFAGAIGNLVIKHVVRFLVLSPSLFLWAYFFNP